MLTHHFCEPVPESEVDEWRAHGWCEWWFGAGLTTQTLEYYDDENHRANSEAILTQACAGACTSR